MTLHRSATCPARLVPCVNVIHGCQAQLRFRDRHVRSAALRFASRSGHIRIGGGDDIKPPWCAEFWVWLHSKEDDVLYFMEQAIRWQECVRTTTSRLKEWQDKHKQLQETLQQGTVSHMSKPLETDALEIGEGIAGCKSILAEARARVKSLVADSLVVANTITDPSDRDEDQQHAKWLAKRQQLLQAMESRQPADPRELARFVKQAKKELSRLDDKLAKCVDVPLALVQSATHGFHTLASSATAGLHEVRFWSQNRPDVATSMHDVLGPVPELRGYWTFEEGAGEYVDDMAGQFPRYTNISYVDVHIEASSVAVNVDWVRYSTAMVQVLGDPPTASYRQRNMCKIVTKRAFLALKHHQRNGKVKCSLGCGPYCGHVIKACDQPAHDATCDLRRLRDTLAAEYYRKHELVQCPFGCGLEIARKALPKHRKSECSNRLVLCDKCGRSYVQRNTRRHDLRECDAPQVLATKLMVVRARTRQESREHPGPRHRTKSAGDVL
ncbi:hypothetical protein DYB30_000021 [Aphanomyces astaci]|uniref:TRAF-type domain-containing protein n=2 Tax=Aphanomyces astaci TaxID=112090 RepID=A0A397E7X3_APHAT|nr:hypothetical protein DYB36_000541 [Aphanomyces astaci]RHY74589.1 hypothetical protein DYB30_000021 [Aphanomyces astaci]